MMAVVTWTRVTTPTAGAAVDVPERRPDGTHDEESSD